MVPLYPLSDRKKYQENESRESKKEREKAGRVRKKEKKQGE